MVTPQPTREGVVFASGLAYWHLVFSPIVTCLTSGTWEASQTPRANSSLPGPGRTDISFRRHQLGTARAEDAAAASAATAVCSRTAAASARSRDNLDPTGTARAQPFPDPSSHQNRNRYGSTLTLREAKSKWRTTTRRTEGRSQPAATVSRMRLKNYRDSTFPSLRDLRIHRRMLLAPRL